MHPSALVIEDNRAVSKLISKQLADQYSLDCAHTLQEALEHLKKKRYEFIVTDISLPDSNYFETIKNLRQAAEKTPIVILTNYVSDEILDQAHRYNCVALSKEVIATNELSDTIGERIKVNVNLPVSVESCKKASENMINQNMELEFARQSLLLVASLILILGVLQQFTNGPGLDTLFTALVGAIGYITVSVLSRKSKHKNKDKNSENE